MWNNLMSKCTAFVTMLAMLSPSVVMASEEKIKPETLTPVEDAYVQSGTNADTNYGSDLKLWVKDTADENTKRKSFVKFDLTNVDSEFEKVVLKLNWYPAQYGDRDIPVFISEVSDNDWAENGITWNTMPEIGSKIEEKNIYGWSGLVSFDVTEYIRSSISNEQVTISVENGKDNDSKVEFLSRENSTGGPVLEFTYKGSSSDFGAELDTEGYDHNLNVDRSSSPVRLIEPSAFESNRELTARGGLGNFFNKIKEGKNVNIVYFGGSITNAEGYRPISLEWMQRRYSNVNITGVNAGIPATGTDLGAFRVDNDVNSFSPDLVFVEFAANGGSMEGLETIIRKIWKNNPNTDICFIYSVSNGNQTSYADGEMPLYIAQMDEVAEHYNIPSVHMGIEAGLLEAEGLLSTTSAKYTEGKINFSEDGLHPTDDYGAPYYAAAIARSMIKLEENAEAKGHTIPAPLNDGTTALDNADTLDPADLDKTEGWTYSSGQKFWVNEKADETISFKFKGTKVGIFYMSTPESGIATVLVDDVEVGDVNMYEESTVIVNKYRYKYFDIEDGEHTVTIKTTDNEYDKAQNLSGSELEIYNNNKEAFDSRFKNKNAYIFKVLIAGVTESEMQAEGEKVEVLPLQDFETNYTTSDWLLRHLFSTQDGVLKASISDTSMAKQSVAYPESLTNAISSGDSYRMVIKAKMRTAANGSYYSEIGLAKDGASSNTHRRLVWLDAAEGDETPTVNVKYAGNDTLSNNMYPTQTYGSVNAEAWTDIWVVIDAVGNAGKISYYVNGNKIAGDYNITGIDGADQVRLAHQNAGISEIDDFEFYVIYGNNLKFSCESLTDASGKAIAAPISVNDTVTLNFSTEVGITELSNGKNSYITLNGEAVSADRLSVTDGGKTVIIAPPENGYDTVTTYTVGFESGFKDIFGALIQTPAELSFTTSGWAVRANAIGFTPDTLTSGTVTAAFEVKNAGEESVQINVIILLCQGDEDDYMVKKHSVTTETIAPKTGYTPISGSITADDIESDTFIKALVWDSTSLEPVLDVPIMLGIAEEE